MSVLVELSSAKVHDTVDGVGSTKILQATRDGANANLSGLLGLGTGSPVMLGSALGQVGRALVDLKEAGLIVGGTLVVVDNPDSDVETQTVQLLPPSTAKPTERVLLHSGTQNLEIPYEIFVGLVRLADPGNGVPPGALESLGL